jgi:hypothetical protein
LTKVFNGFIKEPQLIIRDASVVIGMSIEFINHQDRGIVTYCLGIVSYLSVAIGSVVVSFDGIWMKRDRFSVIIDCLREVIKFAMTIATMVVHWHQSWRRGGGERGGEGRRGRGRGDVLIGLVMIEEESEVSDSLFVSFESLVVDPTGAVENRERDGSQAISQTPCCSCCSSRRSSLRGKVNGKSEVTDRALEIIQIFINMSSRVDDWDGFLSSFLIAQTTRRGSPCPCSCPCPSSVREEEIQNGRVETNGELTVLFSSDEMTKMCFRD